MLKDTGERLILNDNWNLKTKLEHLHRYNAVAEYLSGKVVLDAACGTGYGTEILSKKAKRVVGIDLSQDAINFANSCYSRENLSYKCMSIAELDFPENTFDVVVSFETIEHVPKMVQNDFLKQVKRVLKPDGILIISTPNDALERKITFGAYENEFHICEFTEKQFDEMIKDYFTNTKLYYQTVCTSSSILQKGVEVGEGKIYGKNLDAETERFYIAVCSDGEIPTYFKLESAMRPYIQDYYDEHYFSRSANIYLDTGNGFDGKAFVVAKCNSYDGKSFCYKFDLSQYDNVCGVRFDPMEHAGVIKVNQCIANVESEITIKAQNASYTENGVDVFETVDPIYIIECENVALIEWVEIKGEILSQTHDYLIWNKKDAELVKMKAELAEANIRLKSLEEEKERANIQVEHLMEEKKRANIQVERLMEEKERELAETNEQIRRLVEEKEQYGTKILNVEHTVNDLLYVTQNSSWYKKTMKKLKRRKVSDLARKILNKMYKAIYRVTKKSPRIRCILRKIYRFVCRKSPALRSYFGRKMRQAREDVEQISPVFGNSDNRILNELERCDLPIKQGDPLVTVIVPNYNHAPYLRERLDSIYAQTYTNYEVILLDDCSKDDSRSILTEYAERYSEKTICDFNETNVGRANLQWNKGLARAKGKYIWIAESDDWCEPDFLEKLVPMLEQQSVMIAFARSVFMTDGQKTWSTEEYLHDIDMQWDQPFSMTGHEAVQRGFAIKNIIPNVSSAVFRNIGQIPDEVMNIWENIRLCGDWIFYLYLVKGGAFSYTNETTNYYRIHKGSTSLKVQRTAEYYQESETVSKYIAKNFKVSLDVFEGTLRTLQNHYIDNGFGTNPDDIKQWYRLEVIKEIAEKRLPNVMICNFSMKMGGGEILPIHLANALRKAGVAVTLLDCRMEEYDEKVRNMLDASVPLVELRTPLALQIAMRIFGAEIVHSHHGSVDKLASELMENYDYNQIITLHGMYEAIEEIHRVDLLKQVQKTCKVFAYIADKNLEPFKEHNCYETCNFIKIGNGLMAGCPEPIKRSELNIPEEAFVLCLVSRARLDKGWVEATEAVINANEKSDREIHLILVGDGEAYEVVKKINSPYIHAVGAKENPRAYFATSDMGFLPSRFSGESFPLVVIESLMCGKPVLASKLGEIPGQITLSGGEQAGVLFELENGVIPVEKLAKVIVDVANDTTRYEEMKKYVPEAAKRFDIKNIAEKYIEIYKKAIITEKR